MPIRISKTDAYLVNMMDQRGDQLMSEEQVNALIDDRLGAVIDSFGLGHLLGARERLELHSAMRVKLVELRAVANLVGIFEEAKHDDR